MDARSAKALSKDDWAKMAGDADSIFEGRCFINGEYVDAADGGKIEVINPATNEVCGTCAAGNEKDIDKARKMAQDNGVNFSLCYSSKWLNENDPYMPKDKTKRIWSNQYG